MAQGNSLTALLGVITGAVLLIPGASASEPSPEIIGGNTTTIQEWPWQAAITQNPNIYAGTALQRHVCGGTLVAPTVVVSAAHCFFDVLPIGNDDDTFDDPEQFAVVTGRTQLSSSQGQEIEVKKIYHFADGGGRRLYDPITRAWDVVYVELKAPSTSQTIKVASPDERAVWQDDRAVTVTGWGHTTSGGLSSEVLREVQVEVTEDTGCSGSYGSTFLSDLMVCAGFDAGGKDACQGDSGGPLVAPLEGGGFRLVGDVSFGNGCAQAGFPGVYGRLADDPIRTALANGVSNLVGVNIVGSGGKPPADNTNPTTTVSGRKSQKAGRAIRVSVRCDEDCTVTATGKTVAKGVKSSGRAAAAKTYKLKKAAKFLEDGAKIRLTLKLKRTSDNKKLKKAVKAGARATAKIKLKATDEASNTANAKRNVKLK